MLRVGMFALAMRSAVPCDYFAQRPERGVVPGAVVGGYTLASCLGAGQEGEAWRAVGPRGQKAVVKASKRDSYGLWLQCEHAAALARRGAAYFQPCLGRGVTRAGVVYVLMAEAPGLDLETHLYLAGGGLAAPSAGFLPTVQHALDFLLDLVALFGALLEPDEAGYVVLAPDANQANLLADGAKLTLIDYGDLEVCCMPGLGRACEEDRGHDRYFPHWAAYAADLAAAGQTPPDLGPVPLCPFRDGPVVRPDLRTKRMFMGAELARYLGGSATVPGGAVLAVSLEPFDPREPVPADLAPAVATANAQLLSARYPWRVAEPPVVSQAFAKASDAVARSSGFRLGGWQETLRLLLARGSEEKDQAAEALGRWYDKHWRFAYAAELGRWRADSPERLSALLAAISLSRKTDTKALATGMGPLVGTPPPWGYALPEEYDFQWPPSFLAPLRAAAGRAATSATVAKGPLLRRGEGHSRAPWREDRPVATGGLVLEAARRSELQ